MSVRPFHLAIPVNDVPLARTFYRDVIGCSEGRSSEQWVDFDFFGHQLVIHYKPKAAEEVHHNSVDGHDVPVPHFGVGEQATMFFLDPCGNALEFKAFKDIGQLFAK